MTKDKSTLKLLKEHDVRYLLIGGYAVGYHGYPRATEDLDIWVAIHPDNAQKWVYVLKVFGFEDPVLTPEVFLQKPKIIRMGSPPMRLEITTFISGVEFEECYQSRIIDKPDGIEVNLIDLENLKKNKKASGKTTDIADLEPLIHCAAWTEFGVRHAPDSVCGINRIHCAAWSGLCTKLKQNVSCACFRKKIPAIKALLSRKIFIFFTDHFPESFMSP